MKKKEKAKEAKPKTERCVTGLDYKTLFSSSEISSISVRRRHLMIHALKP